MEMVYASSVDYRWISNNISNNKYEMNETEATASMNSRRKRRRLEHLKEKNEINERERERSKRIKKYKMNKMRKFISLSIMRHAFHFDIEIIYHLLIYTMLRNIILVFLLLMLLLLSKNFGHLLKTTPPRTAQIVFAQTHRT